jgi:hypothetical protein
MRVVSFVFFESIAFSVMYYVLCADFSVLSALLLFSPLFSFSYLFHIEITITTDNHF